MANSEMSIQRALAELKLLHSRIERAISDASLIVSYKKSAKKVNNIDTPAEYSAKAEASYQSVVDLTERRKRIKSAIVASNANSKVTIAGKEMTVAEAIERKESISYEILLLSHMERQYQSALVAVQRANDAVQIKLDELLLTTLGKEGKQKATADEVEAISKPYLEQNQHEVLDVLKLGEKIKALKDSIEQFNSEVDFVLSESNVITRITIEG
jgi:hypothetical protein